MPLAQLTTLQLHPHLSSWVCALAGSSVGPGTEVILFPLHGSIPPGFAPLGAVHFVKTAVLASNYRCLEEAFLAYQDGVAS